MNILVTGANGQLGRSLRSIVSSNDSPNNHWFFTDIDSLDITNPDAIRDYISSNNIDIIVNCAAYTDVERAEDDYERTEALNATAPGDLATAIKERNGWIIHISTDYVFGQNMLNTPCRESQPGNPCGVYGLTKLHGEQNILQSQANSLIIRTSWLYSEYGKNFVKTMLNLLGSKDKINVVCDQVGTPTYAYDLAMAIFRIVNEEKLAGNQGIYNFSNEGICSWYDFAKSIASASGLTNCHVHPCMSDEFPSRVRRPAYSVLDKTKIKTTFGIHPPYWTDSLQKCISNLINGNEA